MAEAIEIKDSMEMKRRFDKRDWDHVASNVIDDYEKRKRDRSDRERQWADVDRQIAMEPDKSHKMIMQNGAMVPDKDKMWMSEMELPLQAQALEVLTADARRLMFADTGPYFRAHSDTPDEYLQKVDFASFIKGDTNEVPSIIAQDNVDKLAAGFLANNFAQYDMTARIDRINAESFRYAMGVGRMRLISKTAFIHEARGVRRERQPLAVIAPVSIKNVYLDTPMPSQHSADLLSESHISVEWMRVESLQLAAARGSNDPFDPDGGWMPLNTNDLEGDKDGFVKLLEVEGDVVIPRKTVRSMIIPNAIITVAYGSARADGSISKAVVRLRYRKYSFSSYLLFPYHYESADDAYPTSPLMKGRTVQIAAVQALNRLLDSAALKNAPPVGYDKSNMEFAAGGGPRIHPYAQWGTTDPVQVYEKIGGDPAAMLQVYIGFVNMYAELTGVLPGRLGAQTVSHTTAFAKDAEIQRGAVRTVDYVKQTHVGPMPRFLDMSYRMARDAMKGKVSFFIDAYGGFVEVEKEQLPPDVEWEWFGAGGPAEEQQKKANKLASAQFAIQLDAVAGQTGGTPQINLPAMQREVLREGGWVDLDAILKPAGANGMEQPQALPAALAALAPPQ